MGDAVMAKALVNGVIVDVSDEDVAATRYEPPEGITRNARRQRDEFIAETDWWALSDRTMTAEQTAYRQALRDITDQAGFPTDITWPIKP
jgi:hypothetical protein